MRVILLKAVAGVGQKGAVKNVSDGYATNYLIANRLAEMASVEKLAAIDKKQKEAEANLKKQDALWKEYSERLKDSLVTLQMPANEKGQLYRQIHASEIAERFEKELGIRIGENAIHIHEPIRQLGRFPITVKLGSNQVAAEVIVSKD